MDVFVARTQKAGRGTRGRTWTSPPGGVYLSAILRTPMAPAAGLWTIAGALAVHDVATNAGVNASLDWPNDLVSKGGAKLAGVLAESRGLQSSAPTDYVLGVGLNVDQRPESLVQAPSSDPASKDLPATTLRAEGAALDVEAATRLTIEALEHRTELAAGDAAVLFTDFFARCRDANARVRVVSGRETVVGVFRALHPEQGLTIIQDDGTRVDLAIAHVRSLRRVE